MRSGRILTALLLGVLTASHDGMAAPACGPYSVGLYEYGALQYKAEDGRYRGIDSDVVTELARRTGCQLDMVLESRVRIWSRFAAGRLDITTSALPTPEREQMAEFVTYTHSRQFVLMHKELAAALATPEAFLADPGRRLIVVRGFRFTPNMARWVDALRARQRIEESPDQPAALRAFKAGRADAMIVGASTLALNQQREPELFAKYAAQDWAPTDHTTAALALSRQRVSEADRALLRRTLEEMVRDGSVHEIIRRHLGDDLADVIRQRSAALAR